MQETIHFFKYEQAIPVGFVHLTLHYEKSDDVWVAECQELGTVTEADTLEQAQSQLKEAVNLQLEQMDALGQVQGFLQEHNVRLHSVKRRATRRAGGWATPEAGPVKV